MRGQAASRIQPHFNCCCDQLIIAIVSCLKSFHKSKSESILRATASMCKISSSKNGELLLLFKNKARIADSSDNVFIVRNFSLCMTTVYIVSLNTNISKIEIRLYHCRLSQTSMASIKTQQRK